METSIEIKSYPDVIVRIHKDIESGIVITKSYNVLNNETKVRDKLSVMCLKYDLKCHDCSKIWGDTYLLFTLRSFENVVEMIDYIKNKANKLPYSFRLKGRFALVKIGENKYIYRISPTIKKEKDSNDSKKQ